MPNPFPACRTMLRTSPLAALILFVAGCTADRMARDDHEIVATAASGELGGRPTLGLPIPIAGWPTRLIPFSVEERKGVFQDRDPYSRGGFSTQSASMDMLDGRSARFWSGPVRWHNAILHDSASDEEWTILDRRGVIGWWGQFAVEEEKGRPVCHTMIFIATVEDTNKDDHLNDLDANIALMTDGAGHSPRQVSPSNAQIWSATYDPMLQQVVLLVVADTDGDGKFSTADEPVPYAVGLDSDGPARPIVSDATRRHAESLLK
jgi:hypothetical protein